MSASPFELMKLARIAEAKSPHPTHKVGALICGITPKGHHFEISKANIWPEKLITTIGKEQKLGNASTTIHAEIAALCSMDTPSQGADIYITDLPCPNCAKGLCEAGINAVYVDAHTHKTALGKKIKPYFETVSLPLFEKARIPVYEVDIERHDLRALLRPHIIEGDDVAVSRPLERIAVPKDKAPAAAFYEYIKTLQKTYDANTPFAACLAHSKDTKKSFLISCEAHISIGFTADDVRAIRTAQRKYDPIIQPVNRLLLACARYGVKIDNGYIYSNHVPTSREFVNMIGAHLLSSYIGNKDICRDQWGLDAMQQIKKHKIMDLETL